MGEPPRNVFESDHFDVNNHGVILGMASAPLPTEPPALGIVVFVGHHPSGLILEPSPIMRMNVDTLAATVAYLESAVRQLGPDAWTRFQAVKDQNAAEARDTWVKLHEWMGHPDAG